jgi:hypothetical protein
MITEATASTTRQSITAVTRRAVEELLGRAVSSGTSSISSGLSRFSGVGTIFEASAKNLFQESFPSFEFKEELQITLGRRNNYTKALFLKWGIQDASTYFTVDAVGLQIYFFIKGR